MLVRLSYVFTILLVGVILACNGLGGKPSTSAPGGDDYNDVIYACGDKEDKIDEWEESQLRKVEDDFIDGKTTLLRAGVETERIEEEARELVLELRDNCQEKLDEISGENRQEDNDRDSRGEPFPTPTRSR